MTEKSYLLLLSRCGKKRKRNRFEKN